MLKQCLINVDYSQLRAKQPPKCGEIFYESDNDSEYNSFQLVCCLCDMKYFDFKDFMMHIRNVHIDKPHSSSKVAGASPHTDDGVEFLSEDISEEEDEAEGAETDPVDTNPLRVCAFSKLSRCAQPEPDKIWLQELSENENTEEDSNDDETAADSEAEEEVQTVFKRQATGKEYTCEYCAGKYTTLKYLKMHLKMSHPHPNGYKCDDCSATFDVERALNAHRRKMHTEFCCNLCGKVYKSSRTLLRHIQGHSGVRQYKCDFDNCGKSFVSQHNLSSHRRVHNTDRNYVCELCGYRSRYRDALIVHRRSHTGEKPFKCQSCTRCFASKSLLNEHQAMHSTERPYKCDKCEAAFSRPKALYHHKHLHLGIKKFKCKVCGNAYAQAAGLSAHMRSHKAQ
ncbi:CG10959, partial [Drosophila busckii]